MKIREGTIINQGQQDEMEVWGYRPCLWKVILVGVGAVCSGGLLLLLLYWVPEWGVKATCTPTSLKEASRLLLRTTDDFRQWFRAKVHVIWAPGKTPFDSLDPMSTAQLRDGDEHPSLKENYEKFTQRESFKVRSFNHHSIQYFWNEGTHNFEPYKGLEDTNASCADIHSNHSSGLTKTLQDYRALFFGKNEIDVKVPPLLEIFMKEVMNPFYIIQIGSFILWTYQGYYDYAFLILTMAIVLIATSLYTIRKNYKRLRDMVMEHSMVQVSVWRGNTDIEQIMSTDLVPGDVINIPANGMIMACDAALMCGTCTVSESMLTGESVPVTKSSVPSSERIYDTEEDKQHTLFCGTHVIQSRADKQVKAVVVRTGFNTVKGQLVRGILYPKPTDFKLHRDAKHFTMVMGVVAVIDFIYVIVIDVINKVSIEAIITDSLNLVAVCIPPMLPVTLTVGLVNAQRRMKKTGIFCISPQRINISGLLNLVCFDKTGTLTEDSLHLWGIQRAEVGTFSPPETEVATESLTKTSFVAGMATCHSLISIKDKLCGDPIDLNVFSATGWILEEPREEQTALYDVHISTIVRHPQQWGEFGIVRQLPFSSALQRMSVVVRQLGQKHFDIYLKGAPETVVNLCKPHTVPQSFTDTLETYTRQGFRVIALAHHQLESKLSWQEVQNLSREQLETNMDFLGLIVMQNKIKEQTAGVLLDLRQANIRTLMVTGDNMSTAISVARDCGMVQAHEDIIIADAVPPNEENPASITWRYSDNHVVNNNQTAEVSFAGDGLKDKEKEPGYHFAVSGQAFAVIKQHFPELSQKFLLRATVFARMTPDLKTQLVEVLQNIDYMVGMCGDGANDCGALKKAHSGISLSELEASVASPFTSSIPNISCVTTLIREGRAALITSFSLFKFVALFSIIQFCSVNLLISIPSWFGNLQFVFIDYGICLFLPFTMSLNPAWKKLVRRTPPSSLITAQMLFSLLSQVFNVALFQFGAFFLVRQQSWYHTLNPKVCNESSVSEHSPNTTEEDLDEFNSKIFEGTTLFYVSVFQYLTVAIVFCKGKPFRRPSYENRPFVLSCFVLSAFFLIIMLFPFPAVDYQLMISCIPYEWRITILIMAVGHVVVSVTLEILIHDNLWRIVKAKLSAKRTTTTPPADTEQTVSACSCVSAFLSWINCRKNRPPKSKYKRLALDLQEQADWPPAPSTITYASMTQPLFSVPF
ncbi:polyamine-transporting ATPase 13A3-like [Nerophis ophidion]|uniref:polyamine-transporting ATPase 13A3-like n=1 Tax=Nerophis ophidion TaxID=159077 RepID=UPI002ADF1D26|nr:polyamine-transporting ATPase 13A3-like [Nerophis ophidion]